MLQELFLSDMRLATLTGAPGIGKTRLALEVAAALENRLRDGVAFVDLAPIRDPALVMPAVLRSLAISDAPDRPILPRLTQALHGKELLLVLDNLEQVIAAGKEIGELLAACSGVRILATSREPLHLSWEREIPVPPLEDDHSAEPAAMTLFIERARAVVPEFMPRDDDLRIIGEICMRLDGLPLAIEMAAVRIKAMPPREILNRLTHRFTLLTVQGPMVPDRHRTLHAAIAWSYDLLTPPEQRVFRTLGVFRSGFTFESAGATCGADGSSDVLPAILALVDKSLVHRDIPAADGTARFRLLESLREFALEALVNAGESEDTLARHAAFFAQYAGAAAPSLRGASQKVWFDRLERDHPDLHAALESYLPKGDPLLGLRLALSLFWFWDVRGHWREGLEWLEQALQAATVAPPADRARGLLAAGHLAFHVGEYGRAHALLEESIGLLRSLSLRRDLAEALLFLGVLLRRHSDYGAAEPVQDESLALFTEVQDNWGILFALSELTRLARLMGDAERARTVGRRALALARETSQQREISNALEDLAQVDLGLGEVTRAEPLAREALKIDRAVGMKQGEAASLVILGECALLREQDDEAHARLRDGLALYREIGDNSGIALALVHLSTLALRRHEVQAALTLLKEAFALFESKQEQQGIAIVLEHLAALCAATGQPHRVPLFLGAADAIRRTIGAAHWPIERRRIDVILRQVRRDVDPAAFRRAWDAGTAWSAAEVGVEVLASSVPEQTAAPDAAGTKRSPLTRREAEVATLVAAGKTNREIAATLVISERTADNHVQHILNKLGFTSRSQIAAWAVTHGFASQK